MKGSMKDNAGNLDKTLCNRLDFAWESIYSYITHLLCPATYMNEWLSSRSTDISYYWIPIGVTPLSLCHVCCYTSFISYINLYKILSPTTKTKQPTQLWLPHFSLKGNIPCENVVFADKLWIYTKYTVAHMLVWV